MVSIASGFLRWLNVAAFLLMMIVNGLAGFTAIIGGGTTAEISGANPTLITPMGYTFSIWGVIYILLGVFAFHQALSDQRSEYYRARIGPLFLASCALNVIWIFLWHFELLMLSALVVSLLLATLIAIYLRLEIGRSQAPPREKMAYHVPFSAYLGWVSIASMANAAVALRSIGWDSFGLNPETWALAAITLALIIALLVLISRRDAVFGLVIIWALLGIAFRQIEGEGIIAAAAAGAASILAVLLVKILISGVRMAMGSSREHLGETPASMVARPSKRF